MSEDKDDLKSIKVYKFNNTKESWHEFALKFRVIADYRGYDDIISGKEIAPSEKENLEIIDEDDELTKKTKKAKQSARMANRKVSKLQARECETEANGLAGIHGEKEKRTHEHRACYG